MKYVKENYDQCYGKDQTESFYGKQARIVEKIPEVLASGTVLDLGAGDGRHALYLASKGFKVKAVDISEAGLEKIARLAHERGLSIELERADVAEWSFDQEYDVIVAVQIFQHVQTEQALRLLSDIKKHTCLKGLNAISLFTKTGDRYLLDREDDPGAFYPDDHWLNDDYQDWEILEQESSRGSLIGKTRTDGTTMTSVVERILARKLAH